MKKRVTPWTSPVRSRAQCLQKRPRTVTHLPLVISPLASISFFPFFLNKPFLSNVAVSAGQINVTSRRLGLVSDLPNGPPKRLVTARRRHQLNETRIINTTTKQWSTALLRTQRAISRISFYNAINNGMQRTEGIKCFQNNPLGADDSLHTTSFVDQLLNHYRRYRWKGGKPATWSCGNERIKLLKLLGSIPKMANPNICCLPCCCAVPSKELRKRSAVSPLPARTNR